MFTTIFEYFWVNRLGAGTIRHQDFYARRLLGTRAKKHFKFFFFYISKFFKQKIYKKINIFFIVFFSKKKVFHYICAKLSFVSRTDAFSNPRFEILRRTGKSFSSNFSTCSKPRDLSWLFLVYLYQRI